MEWVHRRHDEMRSAITRPASSGEERAVSDYAIPPEESLMRDGLEEYDLEALIWEAYEIVWSKIEAEEGFIIESGPRRSEHAREEASLRGDQKSVQRRHGRG